MDSQIIYIIMQGVVGGFLGLLSYLLWGLHKRIESDIKERKQEIKEIREEMRKKTDDLQKELNRVKETLPAGYVSKDEYVRTTAGMNNKLDKIMEMLYRGGNQ
jgi:F0F1-type ATP synthase membrane subunit b/b'